MRIYVPMPQGFTCRHQLWYTYYIDLHIFYDRQHISLNMATIMPRCCRLSWKGVVGWQRQSTSIRPLLNMTTIMPRGCRSSWQGVVVLWRQSTSIIERGDHHVKGLYMSYQGPSITMHVRTLTIWHVFTLLLSMLVYRQGRSCRVVVSDSHTVPI